eukprot:TRINITY_DN5750_c0_g1_i1.p1 TRINITY_DN5750_c0_g1~~TRINITY_DN5750_c0_g1_i1.p1  ORF type:complete len:1038 (+),score=216.96 TRINITY_DN5750_c0_g1_i1:115-3228(+)
MTDVAQHRHKVRRITKERLEKFISKVYFTDVNLYGKLFGAKVPVTSLTTFAAPGRISYQEAMAAEFAPTTVGTAFGPSWATHWFKVVLDIPSDWQGREVHFWWDSNSEAMIWSRGEPLQGLTGGENDQRKEYILTRSAHGGEHFEFEIEMAGNGMFGCGDHAILPPQADRTYTLAACELRIFNRDVWDLLWDFVVVSDMAEHLPEESVRGAKALFVGNEMVNNCEPADPTTYGKAREIAKRFTQQKNGEGAFSVTAMGHCHIDTAWLWPYAETRRKLARSWSSQLVLMDEFPDYKFVCSQAVQYDWLKEDYPGLYARMKEKIAEGRFMPTGGTWVEMDTNMPSGEALARQFLYGQRFFEREFGRLCTEFWLPDTFGYAAQLPQIVRLSGMDCFITQKLSWNLINKHPHSTFYWEGLDGSRVLTHFPPCDTYCSGGDVKDVLKSAVANKDRDRTNDSMLLFGYGDGGGGPTRQMIEQLKRMADIDGLPRVRFASPKDMFDSIKATGHDICVWRGELFFELHQGTFTSQAATKRGNRMTEFLMRDVELFGVISKVLHNTVYPHDEIERLWKIVLLNQFHDVLPGSSIGMVYDDAAQLYSEVTNKGSQLLAGARASIRSRADSASHVTLWNSQSWERCEVIELPSGVPSVQVSSTGAPLALVNVPSMGFSTVAVATVGAATPAQVASVRSSADSVVLENHFVVVTVSKANGGIVSVFDKVAQREIVTTGALANRFVLFDDVPFFWDAWDTFVYHEEKWQDIPTRVVGVVEEGPLRVAVRIEAQISAKSVLSQVISLDCNSPIISFNTDVDWHENRKFLKAEFAVAVHSPVASYEVQYGVVQRPTHSNTSWDAAKFEVCAQRWADISEYKYGVALFNDCKYGHSCRDGVMRLSLLRAPKAPDDNCDMGRHSFRYALYPHAGTLEEADVTRHALNFNNRIAAELTGEGPAQLSFARVSPSNIVLDAVKWAEDSDHIVMRCYECYGARGVATLQCARPVRAAVKCNILEQVMDGDAGSVVVTEDGTVQFAVKPFEVVSLKITL